MSAYANNLLILRREKATDLKAISFEFVFLCAAFYIDIYLDLCIGILVFVQGSKEMKKSKVLDRL